MSELLTIENIDVCYGNIKALSNVSMHVDQGDIVCLIGANGAGKSTLLKSIVGLEGLTNGQISYDGEVICQAKKVKHTTDQIAKMGIALVPEGRRVFADMTVEENLDMGAFMVKDQTLVAKKKEEMYDFFPILGARRALMSSPRMILLDEPGLGLAPLIIQDIFAKIALINEQDKVTIFLVEQNARMALKASNKGYVMENGRIVLADEAAKLLTNEKVKAAYLGE